MRELAMNRGVYLTVVQCRGLNTCYYPFIVQYFPGIVKVEYPHTHTQIEYPHTHTDICMYVYIYIYISLSLSLSLSLSVLIINRVPVLNCTTL